MNSVPENLKYSKTHEWVRIENDGTATVGITDHAQEHMGDMVYAEPPAVGKTVTASATCGVIESVKSASDVYSPISGEVTAINDKVTATPSLLNTDPYGEGWLFKARLTDKAELDKLMDAKAYTAFLASAEH